jgi:hypothetical protein
MLTQNLQSSIVPSQTDKECLPKNKGSLFFGRLVLFIGRFFSVYRLAILAILALGIGLRTGHLFLINLNQPFRLGGLFLEFSDQIIQNHFLLPATIPFYSANGIPFAYPPLGFYIQAFFIYFFNPPQFYTVNLIPPILAALSVPAFYFLAKEATRNRAERLACLLAFALIPDNFLNQIEAAGLAEACGTLAIIGYGYYLLKAYRLPTYRSSFLAGVLLAACAYASPGSAYSAVLISILFGLNQIRLAIQKRSLKMVYPALWIAICGAGLSAPFWLTAMVQNGKGIFLVTFLAQHEGALANPFWPQLLQKCLTFDFAGGSYPFLWNVFIFLGLIGCITDGSLFLALSFLCLLVMPREGTWVMAIAASLLAGIGLARYFIPLLDFNLRTFQTQRVGRAIKILGGCIFIGVTLYNSVMSINALMQDHQWEITAQQIRDLENLRREIPENGKVIVVGNEAFVEWTPYILQREVLNTTFGVEWQPTELERIRYLNEAIGASQNLENVFNAILKFTPIQEVYLVISKKSGGPAWANDSHSKNIVVDMGSETDLVNIIRLSSR